MAVAIRPRLPWEAVDLGVCMARRWWWPLVKIWLVLTLPVFTLLHLLPGDYLWIALLVVWWGKPLWERALLFILSQAIFGYLPSTWEALRAFPAVAKPQLFASLTWRRLSPSRSMNLPVTQLEGLSGPRRRERLDILHRQDAQPAPWLTIVGVHLESFLAIATLLLAWAFIPSTVELSISESVFKGDLVWVAVLQNVLAYAAATVVAPFYVAAGFALYLNRRIVLEGWDIEIAFRQMLQKRQLASESRERKLQSRSRAKSSARASSMSAAFPLAVALFCSVVGGLSGQPSFASVVDESPGARHEPLTPENAQSEIQTLLASDSFHRSKTLKRPILFDNDDEEPTPSEMPEWWVAFIKWLAASLEVVLWCAVALLIVFIVVKYRTWLTEFVTRQNPTRKPRPPTTLFGLDLREESLPDDVPAAVQELWQQGRARAALSLLYRACLIQLVNRDIAIAPGHTEADCARLAQQACSADVYHYLLSVTQHWQALAYGHIVPPGPAIEALWTTWSRTWHQEPADA